MDRDAKQARLILVVDDDPAVRNSTAGILEISGHKVLLFESGRALLEAGVPAGCDIILLDVSMPGLDALDTLRALRAATGEMPQVICVSAHADVRLAVEAMKLGAAEFLQKPYAVADLLELVSTLGKRAPISETEAQRRIAVDKVAELSPRQREILKGIATGEPSKVTAHRLALSVRTVETYRGHVFNRLGTRGMVEAVRIAVLAGLLDN